MLGIAYYLTGKNFILINAEWMDYSKNYRVRPTPDFGKWGKYDPSGANNLDDGFRLQTTLQVAF